MPEDDFGAFLRQAREHAGISLRDIASTTKISVPALEALERNDVSRLPGGIFSRAFVRAYAREVGLDVDEAVRRFVTRFPDAGAEETPTPYEANPDKIVVDDEPATGRTRRIIGWSLPLVLIVMYFGFGGRLPLLKDPSATPTAKPVEATEPAPPRPAPPALAPPATAALPDTTITPAAGAAGQTQAATSPQPAPSETTATPPAPATQPAVQQPGGFRLSLVPKDQCWVTVRVNGEKVFTATMRPGERKDLDLHGEVSLTVGDAGAMAFSLDGQPGRPLGTAGQVATARINAQNLKTFLEPR
ncbi:MAG TPA: RodZ domain-containing protein [Vicinamibacterales bacterium]|jgi:transcriptional regulator with XRE-family HTH domain